MTNPDDLSSADRPAMVRSAQEFKAFLADLHQRYASLREGKVASYISELVKVNPDLFGIAIATVDGQIFDVGDTDLLFTIQAISKVFVHSLALEAASSLSSPNKLEWRSFWPPLDDRGNSVRGVKACEILS